MSRDNTTGALAPRRRFPAFRDAADWTNGRCGDIADVLQGYGFPERYQGKKSGLYPFYKVSDISAAVERGEKYITEANNYVDEDVLSEIGAKPVPKGTTIFAKIGEAIRSNRRAITAMSSIIDNNVAGVKAIPGKISDEFLLYLWSNIALIDFAGGVVPAISKSAIETIPIIYTKIEDEQEKIAACLGSLDDLIAAEGQKLEALREHRKGLMQQLFPREGETQPRLRFPEFRAAPEWEETTLGKSVEISSGKSPSQYSLSANGTYPFVKVEDLNNCTKYQLTAREFCDDGDDAISRASVIFPKRGAAIELNKIRITGTAILMDTNMMAIAPKGGLDVEFLYHYISNVGLAHIADTSTIPQINNKHIIPFKIACPKPHEQHHIADCLSALDTQIAAQVEKLDALRTHKRGLMQQLFPTAEDARA